MKRKGLREKVGFALCKTIHHYPHACYRVSEGSVRRKVLLWTRIAASRKSRRDPKAGMTLGAKLFGQHQEACAARSTASGASSITLSSTRAG